MDPIIIKYAIMAVLAALSGFFLLGFLIYTLYAAIQWLQKKKGKEKMWGGLIGIGLNGIIFVFTFPVVFPIILDAVNKVLVRFL